MANWLILTDLDGSLLDFDTYSFEGARPALKRIRNESIPLALVSSKTRSELADIRDRLAIDGTDIPENGALVRLPDGDIERMGTSIGTLRRALDEIAAELGFDPRPFGRDGVEGVVRETGLTPAQAELALEREGDEPFRPPSDIDPRELEAAAERRGLCVVQGDRYWHLIGHEGKGAACRRLLEWYARNGDRPKTIAIGDAPNDRSLLLMADVAVCIPRPDGEANRELLQAVPSLKVAPEAGPAGWSRAVLEILDGAPGTDGPLS